MGASLVETKKKRAGRPKDPLHKTLGGNVGGRANTKRKAKKGRPRTKEATKTCADKLIRTLRSGTALSWLEHNPMTLVQTAMHFFWTAPWSEKQKKALDAFFAWEKRWVVTKVDEDFMREVLPILSDIFFLDRLEKVVFKWQEGLVDIWRCYGDMVPGEKGVVYVRLDPGDRSAVRGVKTHRDALLSVMLHECVHSFIDLYSCRCADCKVAHGKSGHTVGLGSTSLPTFKQSPAGHWVWTSALGLTAPCYMKRAVQTTCQPLKSGQISLSICRILTS